MNQLILVVHHSMMILCVCVSNIFFTYILDTGPVPGGRDEDASLFNGVPLFFKLNKYRKINHTYNI